MAYQKELVLVLKGVEKPEELLVLVRAVLQEHSRGEGEREEITDVFLETLPGGGDLERDGPVHRSGVKEDQENEPFLCRSRREQNCVASWFENGRQLRVVNQVLPDVAMRLSK